MARPRRRSSQLGDRSPEALAKRLPESVRTFKPSTDPGDLREHLRVVSAMVGEDRVMPVMNAAGISVASWYAQALELSAKGRALRVVK